MLVNKVQKDENIKVPRFNNVRFLCICLSTDLSGRPNKTKNSDNLIEEEKHLNVLNDFLEQMLLCDIDTTNKQLKVYTKQNTIPNKLFDIL